MSVSWVVDEWMIDSYLMVDLRPKGKVVDKYDSVCV